MIGEDGKQFGIVHIAEALRIAKDSGLDVVEVAPNVNPPVCRIMDYPKFKYEQEKREREAKKKTARNPLKGTQSRAAYRRARLPG